MPGDIGAAACALIALYCLAQALLGMPANLLGSLVPPVVVLVAAPLVVVALRIQASRAKRTHRFRIDPGGAPQDAIDHEVAHAEVGNRLGGHTVKGRVYPDGSGYVDVRMPCGAPPEHDVAVDMAGARGEGRNFWTSPHSRGDRANAAARVAHLPPDEQQRIYREAGRLSTPGFWHTGSAAALRRALTTTGRYR